MISRYADLAGSDLVATTDHAFDLAGRLTGLVHAQGATNLGTYSYAYDAEDRLTSATVPTVLTTVQNGSARRSKMEALGG
ncbi:MAG: hypothetical protein WBC44_14710 [Planctomycetaceae bacterium]